MCPAAGVTLLPHSTLDEVFAEGGQVEGVVV
jgi:hypothetical protein